MRVASSSCLSSTLLFSCCRILPRDAEGSEFSRICAFSDQTPFQSDWLRFSPLIGSLALGAVGSLHLLLQPGALLLQLQQRLRTVLLLAEQDDVLQEGLLLAQELHEVPIPIRLGPARPALAIQLCKLMLYALHSTRTEKKGQSSLHSVRWRRAAISQRLSLTSGLCLGCEMFLSFSPNGSFRAKLLSTKL